MTHHNPSDSKCCQLAQNPIYFSLDGMSPVWYLVVFFLLLYPHTWGRAQTTLYTTVPSETQLREIERLSQNCLLRKKKQDLYYIARNYESVAEQLKKQGPKQNRILRLLLLEQASLYFQQLVVPPIPVDWEAYQAQAARFLSRTKTSYIRWKPQFPSGATWSLRNDWYACQSRHAPSSALDCIARYHISLPTFWGKFIKSCALTRSLTPDQQGFFSLLPGTYLLQIQKAGFVAAHKLLELPVSINGANTAITTDIQLRPQRSQLSVNTVPAGAKVTLQVISTLARPAPHHGLADHTLGRTTESRLSSVHGFVRISHQASSNGSNNGTLITPGHHSANRSDSPLSPSSLAQTSVITSPLSLATQTLSSPATWRSLSPGTYKVSVEYNKSRQEHIIHLQGGQRHVLHVTLPTVLAHSPSLSHISPKLPAFSRPLAISLGVTGGLTLLSLLGGITLGVISQHEYQTSRLLSYYTTQGKYSFARSQQLYAASQTLYVSSGVLGATSIALMIGLLRSVPPSTSPLPYTGSPPKSTRTSFHTLFIPSDSFP